MVNSLMRIYALLEQQLSLKQTVGESQFDTEADFTSIPDQRAEAQEAEMKLTMILQEASLSQLLKRWALRCQQEFIDAGVDVELEVDDMLTQCDAEINLTYDSHTVMSIVQYNAKGRFPNAIAVFYPMMPVRPAKSMYSSKSCTSQLSKQSL